MLYTLQGGARGELGTVARQRQDLDDTRGKLKRDPTDFLLPYFKEAERRSPGPTKNLDQRVRLLKDKTVQVMREQLKEKLGNDYTEQLVKMVTLVQIRECYTYARDLEEEERDEKRKTEERTKQKQAEEEERQTAEKRKMEEEAAQRERDQRTAARSVDALQRDEYYKKKIRDGDKEFLDPVMWYGFDRGKSIDAMLEQVRKRIKETAVGLSEAAAEQVANTLTREQLTKWLRENQSQAVERRKRAREEAIKDTEWNQMSVNDIIATAHETTRGSLNATLKRARLLTDKKITMEDVKKWRLENTNSEKRTNRKSYNSWVANKAHEEYQVDLFYFQDLKKKQALKELLEERAHDDPDAARMVADDVPAPDAVAALPVEQRPPPTRRELLQKIKELTWEYESGLLVVDTFSKKVAVVPMKNRNWDSIRPALERAFGRLGGKPHSIYSDAEASMTKPEAQTWFRQQGIVHNITLGHAPVAERMIGVIKNKIVEKIGEPRQTWWTEVDSVVDEYNREHVSRSTQMTPNNAHKPENKNEVKTNLEAIRKSNNPQPTIDVGDEVRVMVKKRFDKSYVPDWSGKVYIVKDKKEWNHVIGHDDVPVDPQTMCSLVDPPRPLCNYKRRFMLHELLRVK